MAATASASARKRTSATDPACPLPRTIFKAHGRLMVVCTASYTTPMPPRPSSPTISYPGGDDTGAGVGGTPG